MRLPNISAKLRRRLENDFPEQLIESPPSSGWHGLPRNNPCFPGRKPISPPRGIPLMTLIAVSETSRLMAGSEPNAQTHGSRSRISSTQASSELENRGRKKLLAEAELDESMPTEIASGNSESLPAA